MSRPEAILLDALGTLLELQPPAPRLAAGLRDAFGIVVAPADAERAIRAEIAFYRANLHRGSDAAGLAAVRQECAAVVREALALDVGAGALVPVLLDAIRFTPFPDAAPALAALRAAGLRLVVVSNWDVSLHEALAGTGLRALVDGALASAEVGEAKPDPAIFARAIALVEARPGSAWHVGDDLDADVEGARRAGIGPVLIDRAGVGEAPAGVRRIASLAELPGLVAAAGP